MRTNKKVILFGLFIILCMFVTPVSAEWRRNWQSLIDKTDSWTSGVEYYIHQFVASSSMGDETHRPRVDFYLQSDDLDHKYYDFFLTVYKGTEANYLDNVAEIYETLDASMFLGSIETFFYLYESGDYVFTVEMYKTDTWSYNAHISIGIYWYDWIEPKIPTTTTTPSTTPAITTPVLTQNQDHDPIYIDGNDDFATQATMEGWDGDGTPSAPYIIDGLDIKGEPVDFANGFIDIENTEVHFKIINCYIFGNGPYKLSGNNYNGIRLYKIKNGHVSNNIVFNNGMQGIYLGYSENTTIASNTIYQNSANGIWVIDTDDSSIVSNTVYDNDWHGILLEDSDRNEITSNTIHDNGRNGIRLEYSNNNIIISNTVYDNGRAGLLLYTNDVEIFHGSGNITNNNKSSRTSGWTFPTLLALIIVGTIIRKGNK